MATKGKESVPHKTKSRSVPSTPSSSSDKDAADNVQENAPAQDKPIPSYLRPTISSASQIAGKQKQQHHQSRPGSPATAGKTTVNNITKKPRERAHESQSQSPSQDSSNKTQVIKPPLSTKPSSVSPKNNSEKAAGSKPIMGSTVKNERAKTPTTSKRVATGTTSSATNKTKKDAKAPPQHDKVISATTSSQSSTTRGATNSSSSSSPGIKKESCSTHDHDNEGKEEEEEEAAAPSTGDSSSGHESEMALMPAAEGRLSTPNNNKDSNEVIIEETASMLSAEKRNKVKALAGAFETVFSLQRPEGQQSPQKESQPGGQLHKEELVGQVLPGQGDDNKEGKVNMPEPTSSSSSSSSSRQHDQETIQGEGEGHETDHIGQLPERRHTDIDHEHVDEEPPRNVENIEHIDHEHINEEPPRNVENIEHDQENIAAELTKSMEGVVNVGDTTDDQLTEDGSNAMMEPTTETHS